MLKLPVDEAENYGIDKAEAWKYTALDLAKGNMVKGDHAGIWQKKESIDLVTEDGEVESMPYMIDVQIAEPGQDSPKVEAERKQIAHQSIVVDGIFSNVGRAGEVTYSDLCDSIAAGAKNLGVKGVSKQNIRDTLTQLRPSGLGECYRYSDQGLAFYVACVDVAKTGQPIVRFYADHMSLPDGFNYKNMPWPF